MDTPRKPDFLIAGMAKCGTSSLAQYLSQHPEVYVCEHKEPRFLSSMAGKFPEGGPKDHLVKEWYIQNWEEYLELFKDRPETVVGEASADTLYFYQDTIPVIKKYLGEPEIIVVIRNPVKRAFSAYQHLVRDQREFLSFEDALKEEENRKNWELIYHYKQAGLYYDCIKAFKDNFPHVKVVLNENLSKEPSEVVREIFDFLGVHNYLDVNTNVNYNVSGKPKNQLLHNSLQGETWLRKAARPLARALFPSKEARSTMVNWLSSKNLDRLEMKPETGKELQDFFREDILRTQDLIQLDLSTWLK
ncbi:MAG: sulfotransferase [Luteibaculum sp.]